MAFSGIVKAIKDLVTGTPADTDYFVYGNTDMKKISLPNLKTALGITALNSSLEKMLKTTQVTITSNQNGIADTGVSQNKYIFGTFTTTGVICIPMVYNGTYRVMFCDQNMKPLPQQTCKVFVYYSDYT